MIPDIAVVGGGVIGLSSAWRLAQGGARVSLYERFQVGREASWAAAGMLAPICEAASHPCGGTVQQRRDFAALLQESRDLYAGFAAELRDATGMDIELSLSGAEADWRTPGALYVPRDEDESTLRELRAQGEARHWGQSSATSEAIWLPGEGQVESRKLVEALRQAVQMAGVEIHEGRQIRQVLDTGGQVSGLSDGNVFFPAGQVLLAAGAWSGKIGGSREDWKLPIRPVGGQIVALRSERRVPHLIFSRGCYLVPRRDGRLVVGATVEENGYSKRVTAGGVAQLLTAACELVPELADAPFEAQWAGLRPTSPDGMPILGPGPLEGLYFATGHGRNGILLTPATAKKVADGILGKGSWNDHYSYCRFPSAA